MTATVSQRNPQPAPERHGPGLLARLGAWSGTHLRVVLVGWLLVLGVFGAFAPQVESALSGAGWQDSGSQSVRARDLIAKNFAGLGSTALQVVVHDNASQIAADPTAQQAIARASALLRADSRVSTVVAPQPGVSISKDGRTAIIQAGAKADANEMVRAADALVGPITGLSSKSVSVDLTGSSALWANFNKVNHSAMIKSEVLSWPVTMLVLVLAFGSLVAAGLPLMLTLVGLVTAAGALVVSTHLAPVSIWAMNFAMMFALALGIDYALFIVVRFRAALHRRADEPDRGARLDRGDRGDDGHRGQGGRVQRADRAGVAVDRVARAEPGVSQHGAGHHAVGHRRAGRHADAAARRARPAGSPRRRGPDAAAGALDRAEARAERRRTAAAEDVATGRPESKPAAGGSPHPHLHHTVAGLERMLHHWGAMLHRRPGCPAASCSSSSVSSRGR